MPRAAWWPTALGPAVFVAAAVTRLVLLVGFGGPPRHGRLDVNNYLELGLNLWRDGTYGSVVSTDYPALYPLLIAPTFAFDTTDARFIAIYVLHALMLTLGTLALLPMLRSVMTDRSAWLTIAAAQFLAGAGYQGLWARSEVLFMALVCAATGAVWWALDRESYRRWIVVGVACGLAVAARRTGLVLPVAAGLVALGAHGAWRDRGWALLAVGAGVGIGLVPELIASALHGGAIETYHRGVTGSHLSPLWRMWEVDGGVLLALRTAARQVNYTLVAFAGAPLVLAATLRHARFLPKPVAGAGAFALLSTLGLVALSSLHILRYAFGRPDAEAWHVYPRYLDPAEAAALLCAVAAVAALRRSETQWSLWPWCLGALPSVWVAGEVFRFRGSRFSPVRVFESTPLEAFYPYLLGAGVLVVLAVLLIGRRWYGSALAVLLAIVVGWSISSHFVRDVERWSRLPAVLPILESAPVLARPDAPIVVVVRRRPLNKRDLYGPGFRTDRAVYWVRGRDLQEWLEERPESLVLTRTFERDPGHLLGLTMLAGTKKWAIWGVGNPGIDSSPLGR